MLYGLFVKCIWVCLAGSSSIPEKKVPQFTMEDISNIEVTVCTHVWLKWIKAYFLLHCFFLATSAWSLGASNSLCLLVFFYNSNLGKPLHTAPRGVQKSKFKNAVFGLKPFSFILRTMFEPKNLNTSTFRAQKLTMSKGTFLLDIWNTAILLSKMMFLHDQKFQFHIISHTCHPLWNGLYY